MNIGERIDLAANHYGIKLRDIASRLGVSTSLVQSWKKERSQMGRHAEGVADILHVNVEWLEKGTGPEPAWIDEAIPPQRKPKESVVVKGLRAQIHSIEYVKTSIETIQKTLADLQPGNNKTQQELVLKALETLEIIKQEVITANKEKLAEINEKLDLNNNLLMLILGQRKIDKKRYVPDLRNKVPLETSFS